MKELGENKPANGDRPEISKGELKGKRAYWRAVFVWCLMAGLGFDVLVLGSGMSVIGKILIGAGLVVTTFYLFRASDPARYFAGVMALFGIMGSLPAACSVVDPELQYDGALAIVVMVLCILIWHPLMISLDVSAYLKRERRRRLAALKKEEGSEAETGAS